MGQHRLDVLQGAARCAYHDGSVDGELSVRSWFVVETGVLELEVLGQLEVELEGRHLVLSLHRVGDVDINLGSVELQRPSTWSVSEVAGQIN